MPPVLALALLCLSLPSLPQDSPGSKDDANAAILIVALGDPDPGQRAQAQEALRRLGRRVEPMLRGSLNHTDAEIAARCKALLVDLEPKAERIFKGRVLDRTPDHLILANIPRHPDLAPGRSFEVFRDPGNGELVSIARAQFERSIGTGRVSLLRVVEGNSLEVGLDDIVVAKFTVNVSDTNKNAAKEASAPTPDRKPPKRVSGTIILLDRGLLATDLRERDGLLPGDRLEVLRGGKNVGTLIVGSVQNWGAWARPDGVTTLGDLRRSDAVQWVPEK
jgi:hypothetical protein